MNFDYFSSSQCRIWIYASGLYRRGQTVHSARTPKSDLTAFGQHRRVTLYRTSLCDDWLRSCTAARAIHIINAECIHAHSPAISDTRVPTHARQIIRKNKRIKSTHSHSLSKTFAQLNSHVHISAI